jgi:hypothetical protein
MFQTKVVEKIKTNILCSATFFKNRVVNDTCKNTVERGRPQMTMWRMLIAFCILTQFVYCSLLFRNNNGCTYARQCYLIRTLSALFYLGARQKNMVTGDSTRRDRAAEALSLLSTSSTIHSSSGSSN